jgi:hypothetical protein
MLPIADSQKRLETQVLLESLLRIEKCTAALRWPKRRNCLCHPYVSPGPQPSGNSPLCRALRLSRPTTFLNSLKLSCKTYPWYLHGISARISEIWKRPTENGMRPLAIFIIFWSFNCPTGSRAIVSRLLSLDRKHFLVFPIG